MKHRAIRLSIGSQHHRDQRLAAGIPDLGEAWAVAYLSAPLDAYGFFFLLAPLPSLPGCTVDGHLPGKVLYIPDMPRNENPTKSEVVPELRALQLQVDGYCLNLVGWDEGMYCRICDFNPDISFAFLNLFRVIQRPVLDQKVIQGQLARFVRECQLVTKKVPWPPWLHRVHQQLLESWDRPITLGELAVLGGVSPVTISRTFPRFFSCTLGAYLQKIKIRKALELLRTSDETLTQVAYNCGFADQSHFTRTFKRWTGMLPKQYQKL